MSSVGVATVRACLPASSMGDQVLQATRSRAGGSLLAAIQTLRRAVPATIPRLPVQRLVHPKSSQCQAVCAFFSGIHLIDHLAKLLDLGGGESLALHELQHHRGRRPVVELF